MKNLFSVIRLASSKMSRIVNLAAMFLALNLCSVHAASFIDNTQAPDSELNSLVTPLLQTLNSGDPSAMLRFASENFSSAFMPQGSEQEVVSYLMSLHHGYGHLRFHSFRHYQPAYPDELLIVAYSELTESWQMIGLNNDSERRNKIGNFMFAPARWPSNVPKPKPLSESQATSKLNEFTRRLAKKGVFSGTLLLAKGNKVLSQQAFGQANKAFDIDNNIQTRFDLASVTKMFTGVAIAKLIQADKLNATDTIDRYLDSKWLATSLGQKIQIQHLLTHTSGLGGYDRELREADKSTLMHLGDYQPYFNIETLAFEPGTQQMYSNAGMFLLGLIIEKVTGQTYHDYIQEHIFKAANMGDSGFLERNQPHKNVATGYERADDRQTGWFDNSGIFGVRGTPDGGAFATVSDMHKFAIALSNNTLLDTKHTKLALSPKAELNAPTYGFGVNVVGKDKAHRVAHEGGHYGISTAFNWYPNTGYTLVVLSNHTEGAVGLENKARELIERIE